MKPCFKFSIFTSRSGTPLLNYKIIIQFDEIFQNLNFKYAYKNIILIFYICHCNNILGCVKFSRFLAKKKYNFIENYKK